MTLEFELDHLTERGRKLLLLRANEWNCSPSEALVRLLEEAAKRAKLTAPAKDGKEAA